MSPETSDRSTPTHTVIGVLGGIASGKSYVAELLAGSRGLVLNADTIAREVLLTAETSAWLAEKFGPGVLGADGKADREALGTIVFSDSKAREKLEGWILPVVRERLRTGLAEARTTGSSPIVLDVPLLLEHEADHGLTKECDFLVYIETDAEDRDRRAQERRGWSAGEVARRERAQIPLEEKKARAQYVVENRAGIAELKARVTEILEAEHLPH